MQLDSSIAPSRAEQTGEIRHFSIAHFDRPIQTNLVSAIRCSAKGARLAELTLTNGYINGESVRLDGAIRMAPP